MGGMLCSDMTIYNVLVEENLRKYKQALTVLEIPEPEAKKLFEYFFRCDEDNSGQISIKEFFDFVELERTRFAKRAFSLFDTDGSGEVDFREFVVSMWNYCTFEKNTLVEFAFDLYDLDGSGEIDLSEMQQIVREVYGDSFRTSVYAKKIMEKVYEVGKTHSEAGGPAQIDKPQFAVFTQKHPAMLFPAFRLQQELQKRVMGIPFWKKAARRRGQLFSEETNLKTFMSNITELAFKDMATFDEVEPAHGAYDESHGKADMRKVKSMPARKRSSAYALDLPGVVADDRPKKTKSASALQRPEDVAAKSARRAKAGRRTSNLQRSKSSHGGVAGQHVNAKGGTPAGSKALHEARRAAKRGR